MRTLFNFILLTIGTFSLLSAQNYEWVNQTGNPGGWDYVTQVDADTSGFSYIVGNFSGTITLGSITLTATSSADMFVAMVDPNGGYVWAKQANSVGNSTRALCVDPLNGDVYVAGNYYNSSLSMESPSIPPMDLEPI